MIRWVALGMGLTLGSTSFLLSGATRAKSPRRLPSTAQSTWLTLSAPLAPIAHFQATEFRMGSSAEEVLAALTQCSTEVLSQQCPDFSDEQPTREISLSGFWLDAVEVSVERYARCVAQRRCTPIPFYQGARRFERPDLPATMVTHGDALRFCRFAGGTLPTEAQFERAARGEARRVYPWGDAYNSALANHGRLALSPADAADGFEELAPVVAFRTASTPEGVLQLAGNASEWVQDRYLPYYADSERTNPKGPGAASGATERVVRGGGYRSARSQIRGAARDSAPANHRAADVGFRCAYGASGYALGQP